MTVPNIDCMTRAVMSNSRGSKNRYCARLIRGSTAERIWPATCIVKWLPQNLGIFDLEGQFFQMSMTLSVGTGLANADIGGEVIFVRDTGEQISRGDIVGGYIGA